MLFTRLQLYTTHIESLHRFYAQTLGFRCHLEPGRLLIRAGKTELIFTENDQDCYYHFAFNIPSNKIRECLEWLAPQNTVLPHEGDVIVPFPAWNAEAIYTLDRGGNIIEFIARQDIAASNDPGFSVARDVLNVSEIGCPVESIPEFQKAIAETHVSVYSGGSKYFCAMGDAEGLFIVIDAGKKTWMPTEIEAKAFPFTVWFEQDHSSIEMYFDGLHHHHLRYLP